MELRLRFREHHGGDEPPNVEAFARPRRARADAVACPEGGALESGASDAGESEGGARDADALDVGALDADAARREPIGVLAGGGRLGPRTPFVMFFRHIGYAIPAPGDGRPPGLPELASWRLQPTVFGWLASVPPPRSEPLRSRRKAAWIVAACLPLVLPVEAMAAPRPQRPSIQVPEPGQRTGASREADPAPDVTAPEDGTEAEPADASTTTTTTEPPLVSLPAPMPALEDGAAAVDQATIDAAWEGVDGFDVELELAGGGTMRGRVGAVQADTFTLIQAQTGAVLVLPKGSVVSLRVRTPRPLPVRNGTGALTGGGVLTALGSPVFITGVTFLAICPSCASIHLPMLLVGGAALGGGIPLLIRGAKQRQAYQEVMQERALSPVVLRTPHGWTGGLRMRF